MSEREQYDTTRYERPSVTVNVVTLTLRSGALLVLLSQRRHWPYVDMWAIPGDLVQLDESLEGAARRELARGTGVDAQNVYLEQLHTFGEPGRDPRTRVISVAYLALVPSDRCPPNTTLDTEWFPADNPPPLAFDHARVLACAIQRLRYELEYSALAFQLLPETFTLTELQEAYEHILDEKLDKRNFRRKVLGAGVLVETLQVRAGGHRPARLYRACPDAVARVRARRLFP